MEIISIILGLLVVILYFGYSRKAAINPGTLGFNAGNTPAKPRKKPSAPRNPYRATSIVHCANACNAARAIGNKRFLDIDKVTPRLPLADCDAAVCGCKYAHHDDRREDHDDRRQPSALQSELYERTGKSNRRAKKRGRRKTDWA